MLRRRRSHGRLPLQAALLELLPAAARTWIVATNVCMPNNWIWWRLIDFFFVLQFELIQINHILAIPVLSELHIVLGVFCPLIELWKPFPQDFAGGQQIIADFNHFGIERRRQDELACRFNRLSCKVQQCRLDEAASGMVILLGLEELQTGLDAQIRMDALQNAGCR